MTGWWGALRQPGHPPSLPPPPLPPLPHLLDGVLGLTLAAFGFVLLFSVAGVSVLLAALALLTLVMGPAVWRCAPWRDPVMATGLILLAYIAIHTLLASGWTPAAVKAINRYHELLMAPILLALFRLASGRDKFFLGLACGAVAYAAVHWLVPFVPALGLQLAPRRISAGFGLAVCAFVMLEMAAASTRPWAWRVAAAFVAVTVLFQVEGRTGHVVLMLLVAYAAWLHSPRRWRWAAVVALPAVVLALGLNSSAVQNRMDDTLLGSHPGKDGQLLSTGIRIELLRNAVSLAAQHYGAGAGYANYAAVHQKLSQSRYAADPARRPFLGHPWVSAANPHSEYLMQLVGGGVAALALFLAWLLLPLLRTGLAPGVRASVVGIAAAFAVGCLFNSLLMDHVEGHLYAALLAWLLAQPAVALPAPGSGA